jgi:Na+/melibiose symporter-like transporter
MKYSFRIEDKEHDVVYKRLRKQKLRNTIAYFIISIGFGISYITDLAVQYFFKDELELQPPQVSRWMSVAQIPWMIKPVFGLTTDLLPVCGYRRKIYLIACGLIACICWIFMSFSTSLWQTVILLFTINCTWSFTTVIGEAIVVEISKIDDQANAHSQENRPTNSLENENPDNGHFEEQERRREKSKKEKMSKAQDNVSFFFFFKYVGTIVSASLKGVLVKWLPLRTIFLIASAIPVCTVIAGIIFVEVPERRLPHPSRDNRLISSSGGPESLEGQPLQQPSLLSQFINFFTKKYVMIPTIFIILFMATPSYSDPMFYFFTEQLGLDSVDMGLISLFSCFASMAAITIYRTCCKGVAFKTMIIFGTIMAFLISMSAYVLVMRYNLGWGIPDIVFIIISTCFLTMLGELITMPMLSLACMLCPKNLEGTAYSIFMSAFNMGGIIANLLGSVLAQILNISRTNFEELHTLILISNLLTLVPLPLLFCIKSDYFNPAGSRIVTEEDEAVNRDRAQT